MTVVLGDSAPLMAALILLLSIIWYLQNIIKSKENSPPRLRGLPIVGYLPFLRHDMHRQLTELAAKHGPIYKLCLGNKECTVISSAALTKEIFRDHDAIFANRGITVAARMATFDFNDIAYSPYGQEWRDRRKIFVREMQSNTNLNASYNLRKDEVRKAVKETYAAGKGMPVNIFEMVLRIDLNLIINMIWGGNIQAGRRERISAELMPVVTEMLDLFIKPNISDFFHVLARFDFQGIYKEMGALLRKVDVIMEEFIDERLKNPRVAGDEEKQKDFTQILVDLMEDESYKASLGVIQIKAMLIDIILGGTDTTSTTVEWAMAELLQNPKAMNKAQQELNQVVGSNNIVEESHIPKLVYLDAVLKEALRMHPIGPILPRKPSQTCTVGGYTIPQNSTVYINVWSIQRDPTAWDKPSEFRPERFLAAEKESFDFGGNNLNYIPFGTGRRICAGLPLAERMTRYIFATLLHSFDWRLRKDDKLDLSDQLHTTLRKRIPLVALPVPRLCSHLYE